MKTVLPKDAEVVDPETDIVVGEFCRDLVDWECSSVSCLGLAAQKWNDGEQILIWSLLLEPELGRENTFVVAVVEARWWLAQANMATVVIA
jgi:hypothetical protein